jgi:hypothetical protein
MPEDVRRKLSEIMRQGLARELAARRRIVEGKCAWCKRPFEGTTRRRYCSLSCAQKAYRQRHHEEVLRRKREAYRRRKKAQQEGEA